jgi:alpha-L-rhamnosidase
MKKLLFSLVLLTEACICYAQTASIQPVNLRCEFMENPSGVDIMNPELSWTADATNPKNRSMRQTAYQVLASTSPELLKKDEGDLWNSGKVISDLMGQIKYAGKSPVSSQKCWWKVKVWDETGTSSGWSEPAHWTMGILNEQDWKAQWISATGAEKYALAFKSARKDFRSNRDMPEFRDRAPAADDPNFSSMLLRREFEAKEKVLRAVVHVSGLGQYELSINGNKIGDYILSPGWTDYRKTILYDTFDVTQHIKTGKNAIGIILSNGMYNIQPDSVRYVKFLNTFGPLKAIAHLHLDYADGSTQVIGTDGTWQASPGPVTYSNVYGGEDYDARLAQEEWNQPFFQADNGWAAAIECPGPGGELKGLSCAAPPIKAIDTLIPIKITQLKANLWIYDLGQNASIMPKISVTGPKGSFVRIIPAELLKPDGTVDRASATQDGIRPAWWQYTLSSKGVEIWFPQFFYQGGRYLQVELFPADNDTVLPVVKTLEGVVVHSSAAPIGAFTCSNELFNRIYLLVRWAQRSNMMSTMTDCPHREKLGWLEQYHLNGPSLRYNFDLVSLFRKGMNDMSDSQLENGFVPNIAPEYFIAGEENLTNGFRNSPEWGSSFIIVPWQQYLFSGDISLLSRYYDRMKRYVAFLASTANDNIINFGLGDWYDLGPKAPWGSQLTPVPLTATAIYYYDNRIMAQAADLLGKTEDAKQFLQQADSIRASFNKKFFKPETGAYSTGSQTANAMPLFLGIVEPQHRKKLVETLVSDIRKRGNAFTSGDVGYRFLLNTLAMEGCSYVIFDMNNQSEQPGYGYQLKMGATALTEKWDAGVGSFGSQNHFMLGQINEWFFHDLVGIGVEPDGAGFRKFIVKPAIVGDISWVKGSYQSASGLILSQWKRDSEKFTLDISIPANTTATVFIPAANDADVNEGGMQAAKAKGVKFIKSENGNQVYEVASGNYQFVAKAGNSKN